MADFLTHLAERALRVGPAVRPALRSRFAPGAEVPPAPQRYTGWDLTRGIAGPVGQTEGEEHPEDEHPVPGVVLPVFGGGRPTPATRRALGAPRSGSVQAPPESHPLQARAPSSGINGERAASRAVFAAPGEEMTADVGAPPRRPDRLLPAHPMRLTPEPTPPGRAPGRRAADESPPVQHLGPGRSAGTVHPVVPVRQVFDKAPEPGPIVRVTIGRIDVRAALSASPAPTPPSSPRSQPIPRLTLDAYLSRRNGGPR